MAFLQRLKKSYEYYEKKYEEYKKVYPELEPILTMAAWGLFLIWVGLTFGSIYAFMKAFIGFFDSAAYAAGSAGVSVASAGISVAGTAATYTANAIMYAAAKAAAVATMAKILILSISISTIGTALLLPAIFRGGYSLYQAYKRRNDQPSSPSYTSQHRATHGKTHSHTHRPAPELRQHARLPYAGLQHGKKTNASHSTTRKNSPGHKPTKD